MAELSYLEKELGGLVDKLEVTDTQKEYLRSRWLSQILWMDGKSNHNRRLFHMTRTFVLIGSIIVPPAIASELFVSNRQVRLSVVVLSLLVAVTGGIEAFYHIGDKWRHYRANVEGLKTEGWLFSLKSGPYKRYATQTEAFPVFAERIEDLLQRDVTEYLETVAIPSEGPPSVMKVG